MKTLVIHCVRQQSDRIAVCGLNKPLYNYEIEDFVTWDVNNPNLVCSWMKCAICQNSITPLDYLNAVEL